MIMQFEMCLVNVAAATIVVVVVVVMVHGGTLMPVKTKFRPSQPIIQIWG